MASQPSNQPDQILLVIHDFVARGSDELSLLKGDRVKLVERDDEFGDGWYLGEHLVNGNRGLFPAVYTKVAPVELASHPPTSTTARSVVPPAEPDAAEQTKHTEHTKPSEPTAPTEPTELPATSSAAPESPVVKDIRMSNPPPTPNSNIDPDPEKGQNPTPQATQLVSAPENNDSPAIASPSAPTTAAAVAPKETDKALPAISTAATPLPAQPKSVTAAAKAHAHGQDSPVMNETLSVIDEHITDMSSPHHNLTPGDRQRGNDSASEYSSHLDQRLSYINGEETDEEEDALHTQGEVVTWTPDQVAEYLFTVGVEPRHCEIFRDQEISGDVLLGMDQASIFLKEFELGSVGRRLKTWQKIKALQDEIGSGASTRRNTASYGSEVGSDDAGRNRARSANSNSMVPRLSGAGSRQSSRMSQNRTSRHDSVQAASPVSPKAGNDASRLPGEARPSAASIRDLHHSRQNSATDFNSSLMGAVVGRSPNPQDTAHKKQSSFDRNWTMGASASPSLSGRPLSSSGLRTLASSSTDQPSSTNRSTAFDVLDRGYFSGGEADARHRNVLRKRGSTAASHSRNSSYTDDTRVRSATAHSRHSRFGSVDSIRESAPPSAAQKYYGLTVNGRRRTPSESSINAPPRPPPPPKDYPKDFHSPAVTKLQGLAFENTSIAAKPVGAQPRGATDWLSHVRPSANRHFGLRAISDAVTGHEKSRITSPTDGAPSPVKESPLNSPSRTGSSTPSAGPSFDLDSPGAKTSSTTTTPGSARNARKKTKKETSAYTRGLEKKAPQEQMISADYSGWMKKKSTNLMTTWKPRLFILKGRRLSYYYSEDDTEEKGLIDISFHRVLPADNDRLTGLHATLTGATNSPTSPAGAHTPTLASTEAAAEPESTFTKASQDSMFIFKLVPPRSGLSRAVTFTKPTVHYFAVPNIKQGRLWMAALMKATIDRDDSKAITTTYQQKTISLAKARAMRHRPPALMNLDEHVEEEVLQTPASDKNGLNIRGIIFDQDAGTEGETGAANVNGTEQKSESAKDVDAFAHGHTINGSSKGSLGADIPEPLTA